MSFQTDVFYPLCPFLYWHLIFAGDPKGCPTDQRQHRSGELFFMSSEIAHAAFYLALLLGAIYGSRLVEKKWPIADVPYSEFQDDWLAVIANLGLSISLAPLAAIIAGKIASYTG